ncbi:MAG: hypothetical protein ACREH4_06440, partial [Vitreimonas sp.]
MMRLLATLALLAIATPALAEPVFIEDFEDGNADGWAPSGGDAHLTQYAGNTSLRLSGRTAAVARTSTRGFTGVTVSAAMAANSLDANEHCLVEVSADGGQTWLQVLRVIAEQDDGVTLHRNALTDARLDNAATLLIGARIAGGTENDQCWLDNVSIAGTAEAAVAGPRNAFSADALARMATAVAPTPMSQFRASADARDATNTFNGVLRFAGPMSGFLLHTDTFGSDRDPAQRLRELPSFEVALVQHEGALVPLVRGPVTSGHPYWDYAIGA